MRANLQAEKAFLALVAEGWFKVTPEGQVWRMKRYRGGGIMPLRIVTLATPTRAETNHVRGYGKIQFRWHGERLRVYAHRAVWLVARGPIPRHMEVNHKNGNRGDNRLCNLEVVTRAENQQHSFRELRRRTKSQDGEANTSAKLKQVNIPQIKAMAEQGMSQSKIATAFGVAQTTISDVIRGKTWA